MISMPAMVRYHCIPLRARWNLGFPLHRGRLSMVVPIHSKHLHKSSRGSRLWAGAGPAKWRIRRQGCRDVFCWYGRLAGRAGGAARPRAGVVGGGAVVRPAWAGRLPVVAGRERTRSAAGTGIDPPGRFLRGTAAARGRAAARRAIGQVRGGVADRAVCADILRVRQAVFARVAEVVHGACVRACEAGHAATGAASQDASGPGAAGAAPPRDFRWRGEDAAAQGLPRARGEAKVDLAPRTPAEPSALAKGIARSARPRCRDAHADLGLLALPFLLADTVRDDGCKW